MPRDRIDDPDTPGLYVQVNCRPAESGPGGELEAGGGDPGHLQISIHDERRDARVLELLADASRIMAALDETAELEEQQSRDLAWLRAEWSQKCDTFRAELTATYVTLRPDTSRTLIRLLHRGRNKAYPPGANRIPEVIDATPGIPRAGESPPAGTLPAPGASGYPLRNSAPEPITGRPTVYGG
jgi:hypothetical protein